jgi:hypothetical protein
MFRIPIRPGRAARALLPAVMAGALFLVLAGLRPGAVPEPTCDLRHPIEARLRPLEAPVRGGLVRLELTAAADEALTGVTTRVLSTGGARLAGGRRADLGTLGAGDVARTEVAVEVPATGARFLIQVLLTGEGATGPVHRLVQYNLLPDGPADPGAVVTTAAGESLRQYTASARRIER